MVVGVCLVTGGSACGGAASTTDGAGPGGPDATARDGTSPTTDGAFGGGCDHSQPFFAPRQLVAVNSGAEEWAGWLSPDELTLYVSTERENRDVDIYVATRETTDEDFRTPVAVPGLSEKEVPESGASLAADGETVHFHTTADNVAGGSGGVDLADARLEGGAASVTILPGVNDKDSDQDGFYLDEDRVVYFSTSRNGTWDIYRAERAVATEPFTSVTPMLADTGRNELRPVVTADERTLYLLLDTEVQVATRSSTSEPFGVPVPVPELNVTAADDAPSWVSPDGCRILISSDRPGGDGLRDLYAARRAPL